MEASTPSGYGVAVVEEWIVSARSRATGEDLGVFLERISERDKEEVASRAEGGWGWGELMTMRRNSGDGITDW